VTPTWITRRVLSEGVEERKERSKEEIAHLQEVAGPDICRLIAQKGSPSLSSWLGCANSSDVFWMVRLHTRMPSFSSSRRIRSASYSRFFTAISLIKATVSAATFG